MIFRSLREGLAQTLASSWLGLLRQSNPASLSRRWVRSDLDGQVGQQSPHLVVFKGGQRFPGQNNLKRSQQTEDSRPWCTFLKTS